MPPLLSVVSCAGNAVQEKPVDLCIRQRHHLIRTTEAEGPVRTQLATCFGWQAILPAEGESMRTGGEAEV